MKRKLQWATACKRFFIAFAFIAAFFQSQAQNQVYWREGFEPGSTPPCTVPSTSTGVATPGTGIGYFTMGSGTWYIAGAYRTTGTACTNNNNGPNHIRFSSQINDANFATSGVDTAYVVTPVVDAGIKELHFLRARASRAFSIYTRDDTSATATTGWNLVGVAPSFISTVTCADTTFLINSGTARRLKIVSKRSTSGGVGLDNDIDSIWITSVGVITIPVELMSFKAKQNGNNANELNWSTASERNNAAFDIERSANGLDFDKIGSVKGAGTSAKITNYNFLDDNPLPINYYRLRQIDNDNKQTLSKTLTVTRTGAGGKVAINKLYPSVVHDVLTLDMTANGATNVSIYDAVGRLISSKQLGDVNGSMIEPLDVHELANGVYILNVQSGGVRLMQRFVKQ
jgi:Secretion system C-terminal sorting domain